MKFYRLYILIKFALTMTIIMIYLESVYPIYPIAIFYGIGQNCEVYQLRNLVQNLKLYLGTNKIKCIRVGDGFYTTFLKSFNNQAEEACKVIKADPIFQSDFSIIGISQGGLIGRSIIEKCDTKGIVKRYISISSPQMGVAVFPKLTCGFICNIYNKFS